MKRFLVLFIVTIGLALNACAQTGDAYRIEIQLSDLKDTTLLLGYHFGDKKFVADTAQVDSKGVAVFQGDTPLPGGMYIVILPQRSYFDILIGDNQVFSLSTSVENPQADMVVKNSPENSAFMEYQNFMAQKQMQMAQLREKMNEDNMEEIRKEIDDLDRQVQTYWDELIRKNPNTFLAKMVRSMKAIEFPDFNIPADAPNADSLRWVHSYQYNQRHYFDNIDIADSRFIRTPFFQSRLDNYFERVLLPIPDTVIHYADNLIAKAEGNKEMIRFIVAHLFTKYQNSPIMGMDAVFVHLAEKYYLQDDVMELSESMKQRIKDRVDDVKPNLIGQVAPNVTMNNTQNRPQELHSLEARLTIIYFWEPSCSHCKKATPIIRDLSDKYRDQGVVVFGVYTQGDQQEWAKYIKDNKLNWVNVWDPYRTTNYHKLYDVYSTPLIYLLDHEKKIVAKRIGAESLEAIIKEELKK